MPRGVYERKSSAAVNRVRVWVGVDAPGVELKMLAGCATNPNQVMGTLRLTRTGLAYVKSNGKKPPEREVTWKTLERLMALGIA